MYFFSNHKILITGHTGFKGTWLCLMLEQLGAKVYGYALPNDDKFFYQTATPRIEDEQFGDIRDKELLCKTIKHFEPEVVIHLASHSTLNKGQELTHYIFETNMMGCVNLFEAIREVDSVKAVLVVTSDKCYANTESEIGYIESDRFGAQDPYSASKAVQELVTECYRNSIFKDRDIRIATARASNVVGGGDFNMTRLFPYILDCMVTGKEAVLRSPESIRPWQNVIDVLYGYLLLTEKLLQIPQKNDEVCSPFNFGPADDGFVTVREVANTLLEYIPDAKVTFCEQSIGVKETNVLKIRSDKAERVLGWNRQFTFKQNMRQVAGFAIRSNNGENIRDICMSMIRQYLGDTDVC